MNTTPYLYFNGDCFDALSHYAATLGGEVVSIDRNEDAPADDRMPGPDRAIMNMVVRIGNGLLMGSDSPPDFYQEPEGFSLQLELESRAEFERIHAALAQDARHVMMPVEETFWAEKFTMFTDRYGTPWTLNFTGSKGGAAKEAGL